MVKLSEEAKRVLQEIRPAFIATADKNGKPNVSAKGSLGVLDDEHVLFAEIASPRTIANIKENPQVSIICLDAASRKSCRIWGKGEIISSGELFDKIAEQIAGMNMKVNNVVKVSVDKVETS
jgi:predicted pyridoxine 5'-phosphate oxidase superfamily flavin-nucleotide-binding protein